MRIVRLVILYTILFSLTFMLAAYLLSRSSRLHTSSELLSPIVSNPTENKGEVQSFSTEFSIGLQRAVEDALIGSEATYSVVVKNLQTGETYTYNPDHTYQTASLYKLWTMAVVYQFLEDGRLQKDQVLSATIEELNEAFSIPPEEAEETEGELSMTVEEALERMITVSENYPALLLTRAVGVSRISAFLREEGFTNSSVGQPPQTTAPDIAHFFEKLYNSEFASKEQSQDMLNLLKRQQINDRIPKYLPTEVAVAHKTGELAEVKHDAGIIFTEKGDYVIVVLSKSNNQQQAAERIAMIADNIYTYLTSD